jgi:hypothetical protein
MRQRLLYGSLVVFVGVLAVSWVTHGTGVVQDDLDRNISIPGDLTIPLQLKAAYNGRDIYFRYRWPAERPHLYIDMLRYTDGQWARHGRSPVGPEPDGMYEDRVTMLVDDGSVPEFQRYGGYITVGDGLRFFTGEATAEQVRAHPHLGEALGQSDVRKYLPGTRSDVSDWTSVVDQRTLAAQREAGYFLDLWHWRSHRSNPLNVSDDQLVAEFRLNDSGRGAYFTNWDGDASQPQLMFDPEQVGFHALQWDEVITSTDFDQIYYLAEDFAVPFDPNHAWQDGDTIPRRVLRQPEGSRGAIRVHGEARWGDGFWDVTLQRAMDTGFPQDDKIFRDQGIYDIGIAVHRNGTGSRWHYVSMPLQIGLGRSAEVQALGFTGDTPDWDQVTWTEVTLFYPGQVNWPHLTSGQHAGADNVRAGVPVKFRHSEAQLAHYGVEAEFRDEIRRQWLLTLLAGVLLIAGFGVAFNMLFKKHQGA